MDHSAKHVDAARKTKAALRSRLITARRELGPADLQRAATEIGRHLLAGLALHEVSTVAAYAPVDTEPGGDLPELLTAAGYRVLLPVVRPDLDLEWADYLSAESVDVSRHGLREPAGARLGVEAIAQADAVVAPALAVGADGARLGKGGGCYDRALTRVSSGTAVIAVLHDGEWPVEVPRLEHDRTVTAVVTPKGGLVTLV